MAKKKPKEKRTLRSVLAAIYKKLNSPVGGVGGKEIDELLENLSMMLDAGMSVVQAFEALALSKTKRTSKLAMQVLENVNTGMPLWQALTIDLKFPEHIVTLIQIGEQSGQLTEKLTLIVDQRAKDKKFRSQIYSAMAYPALILGVTVLVGIGIVWFALPRISTVFAQLRVDLPAYTQGLIDFGEFIEEHGTTVMPIVMLALGLIIYFVFFFKRTKIIGQWLIFHVGLIKRVVQEIQVSRLGSTYGGLLRAGLPILEATKTMVSSTNFYNYRRFYQHLYDGLQEGHSFRDNFNSYPHLDRMIPPAIQQMVITAEQTAKLEDVLNTIGQKYESKLEETTKNLPVVLEPVLLVVVWVGVLGVAVSIIAPIYSLVGGLNEQVDNSSAVIEDTTPNEQTEIVDLEQTEELPEVLIDSRGRESVNVYAAPAGEVIATVADGDTYAFLQEQDGWYEIIVDATTTGWINTSFVTEVSSTP